MRRYIVIGYLVALSMSIGIVLTLGALVAPVIFTSQELIAQTISHYNQGVIMTEIFSRANYWLLFLLSMVFVYEVYDYKQGRKDATVLASAVVIVFTSALFVFYYTPDILAMQQAYTTQSAAFDAVHKGSELDYKLLLVALVVLVVRRFTQLVRAK